jgi:hypothetical protein
MNSKSSSAAIWILVILLIAAVIVIVVQHQSSSSPAAQSPASGTYSAGAASSAGGAPSGLPSLSGQQAVFAAPQGTVTLPQYYNASSTGQSIAVANPSQGAGIGSPLEITGQARGSWYADGSFPVVLTDANGRVLARGTAVAQGVWQTDNLVPFIAWLEFGYQKSATPAVLYFVNANPSAPPQTPPNPPAVQESVVFK